MSLDHMKSDGTNLFISPPSTSGKVYVNDLVSTEDAIIQDSSATAFAVGPNGATNPMLLVDAATTSAATGVKVTGAAEGGAVAVAAISSGTNEALTVNAKGSGAVKIAGISTGGVNLGLIVGSELATIKGVYYSGTIAVTVPSITDPDIAKVDVSVSSLTFTPAVGDAVIAIPLEALPTNARLQGAWVNATDQVQVTFGSEGGNVTGAAKNFGFLFIDLT